MASVAVRRSPLFRRKGAGACAVSGWGLHFRCFSAVWIGSPEARKCKQSMVWLASPAFSPCPNHRDTPPPSGPVRYPVFRENAHRTNLPTSHSKDSAIADREIQGQSRESTR